MAHLNTSNTRMLNPLFRQGYEDMKRFGYNGLETDKPLEYYDGVATAAIELAQDNDDHSDNLTFL